MHCHLFYKAVQGLCIDWGDCFRSHIQIYCWNILAHNCLHYCCFPFFFFFWVYSIFFFLQKKKGKKVCCRLISSMEIWICARYWFNKLCDKAKMHFHFHISRKYVLLCQIIYSRWIKNILFIRWGCSQIYSARRDGFLIPSWHRWMNSFIDLWRNKVADAM